MKISVRPIHWKNCWRVIPTRYPSENLLERVSDPKDFPIVEQLDGLTSTRLHVEREEFNVLPSSERAHGPGSQYIMASFAYSLFNKSRFSDGAYGVFYGAKDLRTSILETRFHREEFMRYTSEGPMMLSMRVLNAFLEGELHDIRGLKKKQPNIYSLKSYGHAQVFARGLWEQGSHGIVYDSVRDAKGECAAVFKPSVLSHCREERALLYEWSGRKIVRVYELQEFLKLR